jgi:hypothetical protein
MNMITTIAWINPKTGLMMIAHLEAKRKGEQYAAEDECTCRHDATAEKPQVQSPPLFINH